MNGKLIVGGGFPSIGEHLVGPFAYEEAGSWKGWTVNGGEIGNVSRVTNWNGTAVISGSFTHIGDKPFRHLAQWDGTTWSGVSVGMDYQAGALAVFKGNLVVGGIKQVGERIFSGIGTWNGSQWSSMQGGVRNQSGGTATVNAMNIDSRLSVCRREFYRSWWVSRQEYCQVGRK